MLIIEGIFSVLIGATAWFWLDSKPSDARWLTPAQKQTIGDTLAEEQRAREAVQTERPSAWDLVGDPQILLFCVLYFTIQLTIYAAAFWLPSIIRKMGELSEIQVGFLNSVPWALSILGMIGFPSAVNRWGNQQAWVSTALLVADTGMFLSTTVGPLFASAAICVAALGFKSAASPLWPIPQGYLDARIVAAVITQINSLGNLGGFAAPNVFGYLEKLTGSVRYGLSWLAASSILTVGRVFLSAPDPEPSEPAPGARKGPGTSRCVPGADSPIFCPKPHAPARAHPRRFRGG